jgi:hypothetical protein
VGVGLLLGHAARALQHIALVELQEGIQPFGPVFQEDLFAAACLVFGKVQPHRHDAVELANLLPRAGSSWPRSRRPSARCRIFQVVRPMFGAAAVGALGDQLGGGLAGHGEVQLVLDDRKNWVVSGSEGA